MELDKIIQHDVVKPFPLPDQCIDVVFTSPPYWGLRDYGIKSIFGGDPNCKHVFSEYDAKLLHENRQNLDGGTIGNDKFREKLHGFGNAKAGFCSKCDAWEGQLGLEPHPQMYIDHLVMICREIKRVLKKSGSFYLNLGDTYGTHTSKRSGQFGKEIKEGFDDIFTQKRTKIGFSDDFIMEKNLLMIPSRIAIALQDEGWILRNKNVWHKINSMPSSVKDRLNNTWEPVFHFVKARKYFYDLDAIREPHKTESLDRAKYGFNVIPRAWEQEVIPVSGGKKVNIDCHPAGKNPGDVIDGKYIGQDVNPSEGHIRRGKEFHEHPSDQYHKDGKNPGDFWSLTTQPFTGYNPDLEHFAVFSEDLVLNPLKAACPKEICKKCGKPRIRITKTDNPSKTDFDRDNLVKATEVQKTSNPQSIKSLHRNPSPDGKTKGVYYSGKTVEWSDCGCGVGFDSGVVLDPFCGRGTVGKVAKSLGLHYILFDAKPEYCELARLYIGGQKHKIPRGQSSLDV